MSSAARGPAELLNGLAPEAAERELLRCCGSARWVRRMTAARPFASDAALLVAADETWWDLAPGDWLEAFAAHPRIGERGGGDWSAEEQLGMDEATKSLAAEIRDANRTYEQKFGHVFLVCATGLSAAEMAGALARRLDNDPETELQTATAEQAKITRLRLEKLTTT